MSEKCQERKCSIGARVLVLRYDNPTVALAAGAGRGAPPRWLPLNTLHDGGLRGFRSCGHTQAAHAFDHTMSHERPIDEVVGQ